jgi:hypothetical protein
MVIAARLFPIQIAAAQQPRRPTARLQRLRGRTPSRKVRKNVMKFFKSYPNRRSRHSIKITLRSAFDTRVRFHVIRRQIQLIGVISRYNFVTSRKNNEPRSYSNAVVGSRAEIRYV